MAHSDTVTDSLRTRIETTLGAELDTPTGKAILLLLAHCEQLEEGLEAEPSDTRPYGAPGNGAYGPTE